MDGSIKNQMERTLFLQTMAGVTLPIPDPTATLAIATI
jgi:hypothetical protein